MSGASPGSPLWLGQVFLGRKKNQDLNHVIFSLKNPVITYLHLWDTAVTAFIKFTHFFGNCSVRLLYTFYMSCTIINMSFTSFMVFAVPEVFNPADGTLPAHTGDAQSLPLLSVSLEH